MHGLTSGNLLLLDSSLPPGFSAKMTLQWALQNNTKNSVSVTNAKASGLRLWTLCPVTKPADFVFDAGLRLVLLSCIDATPEADVTASNGARSEAALATAVPLALLHARALTFQRGCL